MKKFEITTTSMRKIIVTARNSDEAEKIASGQFKDEYETVLMTYSISNL